MAFNDTAVRRHLKDFAFTDLFVEDLGWDRTNVSLPIVVDDHNYALHSPVHKAGLHVFLCPPGPGGSIPDYPTRRRIERVVAKTFVEHLVIFTDTAKTTQVWQWMKRQKDKPVASREHTCYVSQPGPLIQKLQRLQFTLDEEEAGVSIVHSSARARDAFDVEKVTKKFYEQFRKEHSAFLDEIEGFPAAVKNKEGKKEPHPDLQWYTSLTLNRLMFVYFIQKKRFLDADPDYLQNRLKLVRTKKGKDKFHSFYRLFLLHLFHEGLGKHEAEREPELAKLIGKVPYLNGGFFEVHQLERDYPDIDIPDKAFQRLFAFFDGWDWVLDTRAPRDTAAPAQRKDEINPDVVGYIFEKYINQKQMGAYYTKEDITGYITQNTVIPFILDRAARECAVAFAPDGSVWKLLKEDPDRYVYDSVKKGVVVHADPEKRKYLIGTPFESLRAGAVIPLPDEIEAGMTAIAERTGWNKPADSPYSLPTETWREHIARRQRCLDLRAQLNAGEIRNINDLITYNLDIRQFAQDIITNADGPQLLKAIWLAVRDVTILDPTCGSGAFLFAALMVLEPLYLGCLDKMQTFLDEAKRLGDNKRLARLAEFNTILDGISKHANQEYFVLKTIILKNLFGVDIMEEAVEICRLRLFLELVAQLGPNDKIEPLPDIDFNIRAGNTLVGFATERHLDDAIDYQSFDFGTKQIIKTRIATASILIREFQRQQQDESAGLSTPIARVAKQKLLESLVPLRKDLDKYLAITYAQVGPEKLEQFRKSHQPFHWFVEFNMQMLEGGFNVVVGNPPYVAASKVRRDYTVRGYKTERCTDIYAWCLERVSQLVNESAYSGMIVPLSLTFSGDFDPLRKLLYATYRTNWFSSFGRIPAALFAHDVRVRNTIHLGSRRGLGANYTTRLHRWFESERTSLLQALTYAEFRPAKWALRVPKLNTTRLIAAFETRLEANATVNNLLAASETKHHLHFKKTAYNWLNFCRELPPCYDENDSLIEHTKFGTVYFQDPQLRDMLFLLLNGKIELAFWLAVGDDFDVTKWMFSEFPVDPSSIPETAFQELRRLAIDLQKAMRNVVSFKLNAGKRVGNYNLARCRPVTDESDRIFASVLGFETVWEDVELLYLQCIRTDFSGANDEELE